MKKLLACLLVLVMVLAGCGGKNSETREGGSAVAEAVTAAPTVEPVFTVEPTVAPTATPEPLHLAREDVEKYKDCVIMPEGYFAPEYLVVTHPDGTISAGVFSDLFVAESWTDIVSISAGGSHAAGLCTDGTVVAAGSNSQGQLQVQDWADIVAIATGTSFTAGLRSDGTVAVAGNYFSDSDLSLAEAVTSWEDIVAIDADGDLLIGLKKDGTIVHCSSSPYHMKDWTDIVSIAANSSISMGVRRDGTVVTAVNETFRDYIEKTRNALLQEVKSWTNIEKVFSYYDWVFGLQSNGTVLVAGENIAPQAKALRGLRGLANGWALQADGTLCYVLDTRLYGDGTTGMEQVLQAKGIQQIAASDYFFFALLNDGTVLVGGMSNDVVETINGKWQNLKSLSNGYANDMFGITNDGALVDLHGSFGRIKNVASLHDGGAGTAIVFEDGTVFFKYSPYGYGNSLDGNDVYYDVSSWENISQAFVGGNYVLGLTLDGSVLATGENEEVIQAVKEWTDVASLLANGSYSYDHNAWENNIVLGLKADGTVLVFGDNKEIMDTVSQWRNVEKLYAEYGAVLAVTDDNTVLTAGLSTYVASPVSTWTDIADVAMNINYILGLKTDGTIISPREYDTDISQWQDIVQIITHYDAIAGLKADGTVLVAQEASTKSENSLKAAEAWKNIISLHYYVSGLDKSLWGLTRDGTVVSTGSYPHKNEDIVQAVLSDYEIYGLRKDGTPVNISAKTAPDWQGVTRLIFTGSDVAGGQILMGIREDGSLVAEDTTLSNQDLPQWKNVREIVFTGSRYMGLMEDGTVAMGGGYDLEIAKSGLNAWTDILQVDCSSWDCLGLRADGTVVAGGINDALKEAVANWEGVVKISLGDGCCALGLKEDGTVYIHKGYIIEPESLNDIENWSDIVDIIATETHTVGLRSDGTVVAAGENNAGQCDVEDWGNVVAVYAAYEVTVGLKADGTLCVAGNVDPSSNTILELSNIGVPILE